MGRLTQSTEEIQSILDSVQDKADKADVVQPDWDATRGKAAVKNRPFGFNNPIRLSDADEIIDEIIDPDYDTHKITYKFLNWQFEGGLLMYVKGMLYDYNYEYEDYYYNRLYSGDYFRVRDYGDSAIIEVAFDGYNDDDNNYETIITITRENLYDDVRTAIEEDVILAVDEVSLRTSLPDIFIPDSIARQESVLDLYEEASLLWDETSSLWDETVSLNSEVSDIKGRVEELESGDGFDTKGVYPDLIAGDLAGRGESVPAEFGFRASGGKSIKDGRAYIKCIKGNSVVWNQLVDTITSQDCELSETDNRLTLTPQGAFPGVKNVIIQNIIENHVYICISHRIGGGFLNINCGGNDDATNIPFRAKQGDYGFTVYSYNETQPFTITRPILIDLTKMFGAGNEPTTIDEYNARKPIVADEYAYNEGEVIHMNVDSIKSVGDNAWDEQWRLGFYVSGQHIDSPTQICSKNPIKVLPNESYCINQEYYYVWYYDKDMQFIGYDAKLNSDTFVTPSNAAYIHFNLEPQYGVTYKNDIIVTLVHSGWKQDTDAGYQPYWQDTLPLPIILKYFPQGMKSAGTAHDEIRYNKASGKWEKVQRIGSVDISQFGWYQGSGFWASWNSMEFMADMKKPSDNGEVANICCKKYVAGSWTSVYEATEGNIAMYSDDGRIGIADSSIQSDADIMAATQGIILYYELAEPIITEIDEPISTDYRVADFGTEQAISSVPSAPFSADIIYQFNAVDMIREHELEITQLQTMIATMQAQLASLTNK